MLLLTSHDPKEIPNSVQLLSYTLFAIMEILYVGNFYTMYICIYVGSFFFFPELLCVRG